MSSKKMGVAVQSSAAQKLLEGLGVTEQETKIEVKEKIIRLTPQTAPPSIVEQVAAPAMKIDISPVRNKRGKQYRDRTKKKTDQATEALHDVSPGETEKVELIDGSEMMVMNPNPPDDFIVPPEGHPGWYGSDYVFKRLPLLVEKGKGCRVLFSGPRGTSKTIAAMYLAKLLGKKIIKIEANADSGPQTLLGVPRIRTGEGGGDYWMPGPLYYAAKFNCVMFVDELTAWPERTQIGLNPLLDSLEAGYTNLYTGERITWRQPLFVGATNEGYTGNKTVQDALRDRFRTIYCGYLPEDDEVKLVCGREPEVCQDLVRQAVRTANAIRNAALGLTADGASTRPGGPIRFDMSPRALLDWAESVAVGEDEHMAWRTAVLGRVGFNARSAEAMAVVKELSVSGGWKIDDAIKF